MQDSRNVIDMYKGVPLETIVHDLDSHSVSLEIAIENVARDFNMGTIVRSANAFGVRHVHVIGRRQWNKRGAMMTDKYLHVHYHVSVDDFLAAVGGKTVVAVDNIPGAQLLGSTVFDETTVLVFGSESDGLSAELTEKAAYTVAIEQFGSTRSVNVGVAAGVVMYEWLRQHKL